jgi:hypothetical protein
VAAGACFAWCLAPAGAWASVTPCQSGDGHGRAQGWSGAGSNWGTAIETSTWTHYELTGDPHDFTNVAAWLMDNNDESYALESGIRAGLDEETGGYLFKQHAYWTESGADEHDFDYEDQSGNPCTFPSNGESVTMYVWMNAGGNDLNAAVGSCGTLSELPQSSYEVPAPRLNSAQGEVRFERQIPSTTYHDSMAGGGNSFAGFYLPQGKGSNSFTGWGAVYGVCSNDAPPYVSEANTANNWFMGGGYPND